MASLPLYDPPVSKSMLNDLAAGAETAATPSKSVKELTRTSKKYQVVEELVESGLNHSRHSFRITKIEHVGAPAYRCKEFKRRLDEWPSANPRFFFHGTKESNHSSIFDQGFLIDEEHFGNTDKGYIGTGVYVTPTPEYSAAYMKDTSGVTRFSYVEPVSMGTTVKLLGCLVAVGRYKTLTEKRYDADIIEGYDAHTAWVSDQGDPTGTEGKKFAKEYAIRETVSVYPRFVLGLSRVNKETIWLDPNIKNKENGGISTFLKAKMGFYVYSTSDPSKALCALKRKKQGTSYRIVTSGRGGEEFVSKLRGEGVAWPVMVFCMNLSYHKTWAAKFSSVQVTATTSEMIAFASWSN